MKKSLKQQILSEMASPKVSAEPNAVSEFKPSASSLKQTIKLFEVIFDNMANKKDFSQYHGVLMSSEPGVGKTSKVNLLSKVLGIELITIEAPHIVEEHIVQIPFIVFDPISDSKKGGHTQLKVDEYHIELADSNLYSQLKGAHKITDAQLLKSIYTSSQDVIELFEYFGGSKEQVPQEFQKIRSQYNVLLFLDEYFRQTSMRIRNMLRGILNNKLGTHDLPKDAYMIYASNLNDQGVEDIPLNTQFEHVKMKAPSKDEWFSWLVFKFQKDKHIKLNPAIINKFHHILDSEDLSHDDIESEVRSSPRRWEQLLLYINSSLPVKDEQDAKNLLSNVKLNFKNYMTGQHSDLTDKVLKAVAELIKQTSGVEISPTSINEKYDWKETLKHQIEQREKIGSKRSYVPVLAGLPGVAKTANAIKLAHDMNLRFIDIDVSTINAEDVVGLPIPKKKEGGMETEFTIPSLYKQIMDKMATEDKVYKKELEKEFPNDYKEKYAEYEKRPVKYLIFFDEMNRNSPKVFNAIRRVLLEKNFGPSAEHGKLLELPKEAVMLAAINPHDTGAQQLTKHMTDVLDVIDVQSTWKDTVDYMKKQNISDVDDATKDIALDIVTKFANKFGTKDPAIDIKERPFHLDVGVDIWMSPREYDMFYKGLTKSIQRSLNRVKTKDFDSLTPEQISQIEDDIREDIFDSFDRNVSFIFTKHATEEDEFMGDLKQWVMNSSDIDIGENLFYKKSGIVKKTTLLDHIEEHLDHVSDKGMHQNLDFIHFMDQVDLSRFREDLTDVILTKITDPESAKKYILDENSPKKILVDNDIKTDPSEKVSMLENFAIEILYALHINRISNDKISAVFNGVINGLKHVRIKLQDKLPDDVYGDALSIFVNINSNVRDTADNLGVE